MRFADPSAYRSQQSRNVPSHTACGFTDAATGKIAFTSIGYVGSEDTSSYNALQSSLKRRRRTGGKIQLIYVYVHSLDDAHENSGMAAPTTVVITSSTSN